jgi:DNA mismatch endonuclease (patch repair protein)
MSRVRQTNTAPEVVVRRFLHRAGFRFRLHRRDLPGTPDIVLPQYKFVVFVHGCFWHGHDGCPRGAPPKTRTEFWVEKIRRNKERDKAAKEALVARGWSVLEVWECQTKSRESLTERLSPILVAGKYRGRTDASH